MVYSLASAAWYGKSIQVPYQQPRIMEHSLSQTLPVTSTADSFYERYLRITTHDGLVAIKL